MSICKNDIPFFFQTLQGGDDDESSDSENEDNLDWLPDPDKIYGKGLTNHSVEDEHKDSSEEETDDEE